MGDGADDAERRAEREIEEPPADVQARLEAEAAAAPAAPLLPPDYPGSRPGSRGFVAGLADGPCSPLASGPLEDDQIAMLNADLDRARVKKREGRGGGQFSYLEGHDVKRTANEIFGFGNWGYRAVKLVELEAVEVVKKNGAPGWHVGYRAVVELTVRGCIPIADVGYGDGVEYGYNKESGPGSSRVTAQELAMKEAVTDGLKRALVAFGDQFGLVLYEKDEGAARARRDANADEAQTPQAKLAAGDLAMDLGTALSRLALWTSEEAAKAWIKEGYVALHEGKEFPARFGDLPSTDRLDLLRRVQAVVFELEADATLKSDSPLPVLQAAFRASFARNFEGVQILGPPEFEPSVPF